MFVRAKKKLALFICIILLALLTVFFRYAGVGIVSSDSPETRNIQRMENCSCDEGKAAGERYQLSAELCQPFFKGTY